MVVTPFGEFGLDDDVAERRWIDAHARRHHTYTVAAQIGGGGTVRGNIDADWFHRHWARHESLARYTGLDLAGFTQGLAIPQRWETEQQLISWHDLHNRIHLKQDRQLKIS